METSLTFVKSSDFDEIKSWPKYNETSEASKMGGQVVDAFKNRRLSFYEVKSELR